MSRIRLGWTLLLCVVLLPSCGRKGPPLAPRAVVPVAVTDVAVQVQPDGVVVSWTRPWRNTDGSALSDLAEFRIWRVGADSSAPTGPTPRGAAPLATVSADRPQNALQQGGRYSYWDDAGLAPGMRYRYHIQAVNRGGESGAPSAEVTVDFLPPPPPPTGVTARAQDGAIELTWQPPGLPAGVPLHGYNVYRRVGTAPYGSQPVNAQPVLAARFRDAGLAADATYSYVVRSVGNAEPPWREGPNSAEVPVTLEDLVPPAPPQGLVAVPGLGAIGLSWAANAEPDVLGYVVYRRAVEATDQVRLTEAPIPGTTYTDRTSKPGVSYLYTVTAVDRSARRNESAPSAEVEARIP